MVAYERVRKAIGREIRRQRIAAKLTQQELAARIHTSGAYVGRVERGVTNLTAQEFVRIAVAIGTDPVQLLGRVTEGRGEERAQKRGVKNRRS